MADEEQVRIIKQGVRAWNVWRSENPSAAIDLSSADLSRHHLSGALLNKANLSRANFELTYFTGADLSEANLTGTALVGAYLGRANLSRGQLREAILRGADLTETNLTHAHLRDTDFRGASLDKTNLAGAELNLTIFGNSNLSEAAGLENVAHTGPSSISIDALPLSKGKIPESFLRGCGLSDLDIEYAKLFNPELNNEGINKILYRIYDLRATQALQISPLFISYSHNDAPFVDKIENHLNKKGIRFWRDVHDATAGRLEKQIDRAMRLKPTVLLILSERSVISDWVEHEVRAARDLEKEMGRDILCPIALDDSWKKSPWPKRLMEQVMEYNILDFSAWEDNRRFEAIFRKLIDGLQLFYKG